MVLKFWLLLIYVCSACVGLVFVKKFFNGNSFGMLIDGAATDKYQFYLGVGLYASSFLCWIYLVSEFRLSIILPIAIGCVYLFSLLLAVLFLGEILSTKHLIGSLLILVGLLLLSTAV